MLTEDYRNAITDEIKTHSERDLKLSSLSADDCKMWLENKSLSSATNSGSINPTSSLHDISKIPRLDDNFETKFFELGQGELPYKFDFQKIFNPDNLEKQNCLMDGLANNLTLFNCMQEISKLETDMVAAPLHNTEHVKLQETREEAEELEISESTHNISIVDYGLDYYDPNDNDLMDNMLRDALDIMKRDHKFVFASLPAAHRMPILREWIRLRYGKTYSKKELSESFLQSKPIITALIKIGLSVKLPSNYDIGRNMFTDYCCRNYVLRKVILIRFFVLQ